MLLLKAVVFPPVSVFEASCFLFTECVLGVRQVRGIDCSFFFFFVIIIILRKKWLLYMGVCKL